MPDFIHIHPNDNVAVALHPIAAGTVFEGVTANVDIPQGKALPAYGVYACWMQVEERIYPAVVNVGRHPTLPEGSVTVEAYALDECLSLYGKKVRLLFLDFLRPEKKFPSLEELQKEIQKNTLQTRKFFEKSI